MEEAGLVEMTGLDMHERFLARLTVRITPSSVVHVFTWCSFEWDFVAQISSLNLLRVISEQENVSIEQLNAGRVCDWFVKDKAKRDQGDESSVLDWKGGPMI